MEVISLVNLLRNGSVEMKLIIVSVDAYFARRFFYSLLASHIIILFLNGLIKKFPHHMHILKKINVYGLVHINKENILLRKVKLYKVDLEENAE